MDEEEQGAWFRVKGSKISRDSKFGFENKYTAYELGYDQVTKRTADKTRYQGVGLAILTAAAATAVAAVTTAASRSASTALISAAMVIIWI